MSNSIRATTWRGAGILASDDVSRVVLPELLDALPQNSPDAQASRRDLRLINRVLGSNGWFLKMLREHSRTGEPVLEIGAGAGEMGLVLSARTAGLAGLDLCRRPRDWPRQALWYETDVLEFDRWPDHPIVIGNLFFHHFDSEKLARLGRPLNEYARVIVASEPLRRRRTTRLFSVLCALIRAHQVTRHDGRVSIAAGFRHDELPRLLHLDPAVWTWRVQETLLGACRLVAKRRA